MTITGCARAMTAAVLCCLAAVGAARAAQPTDSARTEASAIVARAVDGNTLVLDTGSELRLSGIDVPKAMQEGVISPLAEEARAALERATVGKRVMIRTDGSGPDRYGRITAQLYTFDGMWVQGLLLMEGLARVWTPADRRARVADMLALEREARAKQRGIWSDGRYRVRMADGADRYADSFQLIEGTVRSVSAVRGRTYLNFGPNWQTDFTITIDPADLKRFREAGIEPRSYEGRRVRVRGWIKSMNGPMIQATYPEQIEVLAE